MPSGPLGKDAQAWPSQWEPQGDLSAHGKVTFSGVKVLASREADRSMWSLMCPWRSCEVPVRRDP